MDQLLVSGWLQVLLSLQCRKWRGPIKKKYTGHEAYFQHNSNMSENVTLPFFVEFSEKTLTHFSEGTLPYLLKKG